MTAASAQNINFKDLISKDLELSHQEDETNSLEKNGSNDIPMAVNLPDVPDDLNADQEIIKNLNSEIISLKENNSNLRLGKNVSIFLSFILFLSLSVLYFDSKEIVHDNKAKDSEISRLNLKISDQEQINLLNKTTIDLQDRTINVLKTGPNFNNQPKIPDLPPLFLPNIEPSIAHLSQNEKDELRKLDFKLAMIEKEKNIKLALLRSEKKVMEQEMELLEVKHYFDLVMLKKHEMDESLRNSRTIVIPATK